MGGEGGEVGSPGGDGGGDVHVRLLGVVGFVEAEDVFYVVVACCGEGREVGGEGGD